MPPNSMPRLGVAVEHHYFETLGDWIFKHNRAIEIQDFAMSVLDADKTASLIKKYSTLLDGYAGEIGIHGPFIGFDIASGDPEIRKVVKKRLLQGLKTAEALKATQMVVHSPFNQWLTQNTWNFEWLRPMLFENALDTLAPAVKRAEEIGCMLVLENINDVVPADRRKLVDAVASPNLKLSVDTGHAHLVHGSNGAPPVDYFIKDAGEMLAHVHLQDADGYADRHWIPGEGSILWTSVFDAIAAMKEQPRLIIEVMNNIHRIPGAVRALKARGLAC